MNNANLMVIPGAAVRAVLDGADDLLLKTVTAAYIAHAEQRTQSVKPPPLFANGGRFFAMPAALEEPTSIVGVKWVASFVGNIPVGAERAAAVLVVNDVVTGRPVAVVDGTLISARRTAAGATVALQMLHPPARPLVFGVIGCGPINFEICRLVTRYLPVRRILVADRDGERADGFARRSSVVFPDVPVVLASGDQVLERVDAVSIATNATAPHIMSLPSRPLIVLHISLRDLSPGVIANAYNIVDDVAHVFSAKTSLHLAKESTGRVDFVHGTIGDLLRGAMRYEAPSGATVVSPFGLAILDLAVLHAVLPRIQAGGQFSMIPNFQEGVWQ